MPRYVDVGVLKEWIENWLYKDRYYHNGRVGKTIPITELYDILEQLPTANVPDRKVGEWKHGYCSECEYNWGKDAPIASVPNFCPNCGARMKTADNERDYERAIEQMQHDMLYEKTYNSEDGSM